VTPPPLGGSLRPGSSLWRDEVGKEPLRTPSGRPMELSPTPELDIPTFLRRTAD
jgi:hypothetical protein